MTFCNCILGGLALLAALMLSLMPGGRAMRYLGPCGQSLCACPEPEPVSQHCPSCERATPTHLPVHTLSLADPNYSSMPGKLLSWTDDFTPTLTVLAVVACEPELKDAELPVWHSSYRIPAADIPHPPPRA